MPQFRGGTPAPQYALHVLSSVLDSSTMSVGWTVTPDVLAEVTKQEAEGKKSWMMLLIFSKGVGHEQRKIVPLKDCIAYLSLRRPGKTRVYGQILCGSKKDVFKTWLTKECPGRWDSLAYTILEEDGFPAHLGALREHTVGPEISINVEAPTEVFAKSPPEWEMKWVNRMFPRTPAYDQCDFRRRRIFAYTVQPLLAVAWTSFIALAQLGAFAFFLAKPARKPWAGMGLSTDDPFDGTLLPDNGTTTCLFFPVFWWAPAVLAWMIFRHHHGHLDLRGLVAFGAVGVPAIILLTLLNAYLARRFVAYTKSDGASERLAAVGYGLVKAVGFVTEPFVKFGIWFLSTALTDEDIQILTTPKQERAAMELRDLPASKRTIKLRFFDLKAKVCRPFAR